MITWALVGASDVAATRMIPAIRDQGGQIRSVYSSVLPHAQQFATAQEIPRPTDELEAVFDGVEAVYISTQNPKHGEHTRAALEAGLHVLVEKPMTLNLDEAIDLICLARDRGKVLAVNHHLPNSTVVTELAKLVTAGAVGRVLGIRVNHAVNLPTRLQTWRIQDIPGAGVIYDVTVHDAAVVAMFIDKSPTSVAAQAVRQGPWPKGAYDAVMSTWRWGDEMCCQTYDAFTIKHNVTSIDVFGSEATLNATNIMTQDPVGDITITTDNGIQAIELPTREDLYHVSVGNFVAATEGEGTPTVSGLAGTQATAIALAVDQAACTGMCVEVVDTAARVKARI